jgi:succinoglycan biosynthesis protein ExoA
MIPAKATLFDHENNEKIPLEVKAGNLFISVIVPVRNESKNIEHTITQLVAQAYDPHRFEILVVDGDSTDDTPQLVEPFVERYPNVRLLHNPKKLSSAARNIGIRESRGDVVLIVDGHCEFEDAHLLEKVADAFIRSGADCLGRPQPQEIAEATPLQRAIALARSSRLGHHPASYVYSNKESFVPAQSVAVAYRREVFDKVGHFDERFDACEDVEFNYRVDRAGLRCFFTPNVSVRYRPRNSLSGLFRQIFRYGRGRVRLVRKHPLLISAGTFAPLVLLIWILFILGLSFLYPIAIIAGAITLLGYIAVLIIGAIFVATRNAETRLAPHLFVIWTVIHFAAAFGMLGELLCRLRIRSSAKIL